MAVHNFIDLTGQKFGKLTVIERADNDKHGCTRWLCECECGNIKVISGNSLRQNKTKSCGCIKTEKAIKKGSKCLKDLTGQKFGRLTVIEKTERKSKGDGYYYVCKCECGNIKEVAARNLTKGATKSCGCYRKEQKVKHMKRLNEVQWKNEKFKTMQVDKMKEKWQDEQAKKVLSDRMKKMWENDEYRQRKVASLSGKENPNFKGGITPISMHLRNLNGHWFSQCKQQANYTCQLTGQIGGQLHTHHLKAFSTIVLEAHELYDIQIKEIVGDYTDEELKLLEEYVASWHKDNSNAVVLCDEAHNLFHKLYGKGNNTPEQYIEFKERYLAGEFKEILK